MAQFQPSFRVLIHGGAGVIPRTMDGQPYYSALSRILKDIYIYVTKHHTPQQLSALDIAEFAVIQLENEPLFNAGKGAVFTSAGTHELEASIMNGSDLLSGAVSLVKTVKNPVSLARAVMKHTNHCYIIGQENLDHLARLDGLEVVDNFYFSTERRYEQLLAAQRESRVQLDHSVNNIDSNGQSGANADPEHVAQRDDAPKKAEEQKEEPVGLGTVGAAVMYNGAVAAATSTGGMTNKMPGRVGDSPIVGAGNYANNLSLAVSATGHGELFVRTVCCHDIHCRMTIGQLPLKEAVAHTVHRVLPDDSGGVIAVSPTGEFSMDFNSPGMFRGMCSSEEVYDVASTSLSSSHAEHPCGALVSVGIWEELQQIHV